MTNRKLHTPFRLVPKSTTLDDAERPIRILFHLGFLVYNVSGTPIFVELYKVSYRISRDNMTGISAFE